ncbi:helix-turn-helix domain-containing protein [Aureivirga sp. CE67]|uniref:helix-turn-helix domain-containing protein n=1 Tax=Aureivirga sp. CE67 TaxID=1788983 RepID=UPI0018CB958A|nr:helix-turn-helix domain-containing protein [Aureivirga sp. CE67]
MRFHIELLSQIHNALDLEKPKNPLISVIDMSKFKVKDTWIDIKYSSSLYTITLKDESCGMEYGRNTYDFQEGVMSFIAPEQVFRIKTKPYQKINGWMLNFHPELIRNTALGMKMNQLNFFSYNTHEALHLSEQEQETVTNCIKMIDSEIQERIDRHSNSVIVSSLELFFNYCIRFYERQFHTRASENKDILSKVEFLLKQYYSKDIRLKGLPTVSYLAENVNLSPGYLSDLLKNETGKSAKEHINLHLIEKAKIILLNSNLSVSEIAYDLGFEYPQHFSKMFKSKTGMSPTQYRNVS